MANTFELIASSTVGSGGAASIDFTSIPSTFTDLCLVISARSTQANIANSCGISFNGSTTGFTSKFIEGSGSSVSSFTNNSIIGNVQGTLSTANTFTSINVYIPNYAGSSNKSFSAETAAENNATTAYITLGAGLWSNTAAINQVTLTMSNFVQYSTAYLYGVKNA